jgi:hypothetical protein
MDRYRNAPRRSTPREARGPHGSRRMAHGRCAGAPRPPLLTPAAESLAAQIESAEGAAVPDGVAAGLNQAHVSDTNAVIGEISVQGALRNLRVDSSERAKRNSAEGLRQFLHSNSHSVRMRKRIAAKPSSSFVDGEASGSGSEVTPEMGSYYNIYYSNLHSKFM